MIVATVAPAMRCQRYGSQPTSTRSVIRNHIAAAPALHTAASTLMRMATFGAIGRTANTRPMRTKSGFPGGWQPEGVRGRDVFAGVPHRRGGRQRHDVQEEHRERDD